MELEFEWDEDKAQANEAKHGVSFMEARTIFGDPNAITIADEAHSLNEERWVDIGRSHKGRVLVLWYTARNERIRIIGCRKANRQEEQAYYER